MKFKKALYLSLIPLTLVPILILGSITLSVTADNVVASGHEYLEEVAESSGISLEKYIKAQKREIKIISQLVRISECLQANEENRMTEEIRVRCEDALYNWVMADTNYNAALLLDVQGRVIAAHDGSFAGEDFSRLVESFQFTEGEEAVYSEVQPSVFDAGRNVIYIGYLIKQENHSGILVLETSLDFYNKMVENITIGETGASFIVNASGITFCHSNPKLQVLLTPVPEIREIVEDYYNGEITKRDSFSYNYENDECLLGYYVMEDPDWVFVTGQSFSEINKPLVFLTRFYIILLMIALITALTTCVLLIQRFTRPIQKLRSVFLRAAREGEYIGCEIQGNNEFSELADGYNAMIARLAAKDEEVRFMALHDNLTGINNRNAFEQMMDELLSNRESGAVFYLGLDGFKNVNNLFGHEIGDKCLKEAAGRIINMKHGGMMTARTGGDKFYMIKLGEEAEAELLADEIIKAFKEPFDFAPLSISLSVSVGIARFPEDASGTIEIMKCANTAMYEAKANGKNQCCYYNSGMTTYLERHNEVLKILDYVADSGEAYLCYQPEVASGNDSIVAFEALMRINSSKLGFISPGEFIPLAESSGKIIPLGKWVLESAARFVKQLLKENRQFDYVAVNISTVQLGQPDFVSIVIDTLKKEEVELHYILLEITESVLMTESSQNIHKLAELRSYGLRIALDDFGTGYSSMQYLAELPLDILKIDKYFIDEITFNDRKKGIIKIIIDMAHLLDLQVVAEGVETGEQSLLLKEMGCDMIQGYYYYKPMEDVKIAKILEVM